MPVGRESLESTSVSPRDYRDLTPIQGARPKGLGYTSFQERNANFRNFQGCYSFLTPPWLTVGKASGLKIPGRSALLLHEVLIGHGRRTEPELLARLGNLI